MTEHVDKLVVEEPRAIGAGGLFVARQGILLLPPPRDAMQAGELLGRETHRQHSAARSGEGPGMDVDRRFHRQVVHVLHAADHLHVLGAGGDRVAGLREGLERRAAEPVDRRAGRREGQVGHQADGAGHVAPQFAPLLRDPEEDVFDRRWIDPAPLHHGSHHRAGEVIAPHVAEDPALGMRAADGRAATGNHHGRGGGIERGRGVVHHAWRAAVTR